MKVTPKSEKQIAEENNWPAGKYGFEIIEATEKVSKKGNEMLELKLKIFNDEGKSLFINDYLMDSKEMAFKLRHAADCCGLLAQYEAGQLQAFDFEGKTGFVKVKIQKDKTGEYPDRNAVADYVKASDATAEASVNGAAPFIEDSVPF